MTDPCPRCNEADLAREHAHGRCPKCGYIEPCCTGAPYQKDNALPPIPIDPRQMTFEDNGDD